MASSGTETELRQQRIAIERRLAELVAEQQRFYTEYVKANAAAAGTIAPSSVFSTPKKPSAKARTTHDAPPMSLELADKLDRSTPTGAFEYGRAHIEACSAEITRLRAKEAKLAKELDSMVIERNRRQRRLDFLDSAVELRRRASGLLGRELG